MSEEAIIQLTSDLKFSSDQGSNYMVMTTQETVRGVLKETELLTRTHLLDNGSIVTGERAASLLDDEMRSHQATRTELSVALKEHITLQAALLARDEEIARLKAELQGERNMHGQTRVVVEELNTICNDLRNAGKPQFVRSEAIRLLREAQCALEARATAAETALATAREALQRCVDDPCGWGDHVRAGLAAIAQTETPRP